MAPTQQDSAALSPPGTPPKTRSPLKMKPVDEDKQTKGETGGMKRVKSDVSQVAMDNDYSGKTVKIQKETLAKSYAVAFQQLRDMKLPDGDTAVCVIDLGAADGINSIPLFKGCVEEVRKRDEKKPMMLVFEDQPCNDFSLISKLEASEFGSKCFPMISNIGFFDPCVPPGTAHLSFTSHAMHYLAGEPPCNIKKGMHHTVATPEENKLFAIAAEQSWERLLLARASELAVGGRAVLSNLCTDETTGWFCGSTDRGNSFYTVLGECVSSMADDGLMTPLEVEWATSPEYYRTVAEHKKPFEDPNSPVRKAGLVLKSAEVQISRCAFPSEYAAGEYESAEHYGKVFAHVTTSFSYHKVMRAFQNPLNKRTPEEQRKLSDQVYARLAKRVESEPETFGIDHVCLVMVIEKVA